MDRALQQTSAAVGSLQHYAATHNETMAEAFMQVNLVIAVDVSYSMADSDADAGQTRAQVAQRLLLQWQEKYEGKILLLSFNDSAQKHLNGRLPEPSLDTKFMPAFELAKKFCVGGIPLCLISDGLPSEPEQALLDYVKKNWVGNLHTAFAGPAGSEGETFLKRLAQAAHGQHTAAALSQNAPRLTAQVSGLLEAGRTKI